MAWEGAEIVPENLRRLEEAQIYRQQEKGR
jgi:hypothetical protein